MIRNVKDKIIGVTGSVTGITSVLGSWQICHNICLSIISLLAVLGITLTWMPFLFLTKIAIYLWGIAMILLITTIILYIKKHCISNNLILFNLGLITMGTPFKTLDPYIWIFWIVGGILILTAIFRVVRNKMDGKK